MKPPRPVATVLGNGAILIACMRRLAPPSDALDLGIAAVKQAVQQAARAIQDAA
jgi:hypothetical protein